MRNQLPHGRLAIVRHADEVMLETDQTALAVHRCLHVLETADPEEVMVHVVFPGPGQLHRRTHAPGDRRRLADVLTVNPAAEAAAEAHLVRGDVRLIHPEHGAGCGDVAAGKLSRDPQLQRVRRTVFAMAIMGRAVHGLHAEMGHERVIVKSLEGLVIRILEGSIHITFLEGHRLTPRAFERPGIGSQFCPAVRWRHRIHPSAPRGRSWR